MSDDPRSSADGGHGIIRVSEGVPVVAADGAWGEVADLVVDPATRRVTHLVVQPHARHGEARLVAMSAVITAGAVVTLTLSAEEIEAARLVASAARGRRLREPFAGVSPGGTWAVGTVQPFGGSPTESTGARVLRNAVLGRFSTFTPTTYDRIPAATAELDRVTVVVDRDDSAVGHVEGLIVDGGDAITHVIVDRGHLWKRRHVVVPITDVDTLSTDRVELVIDRTAVDHLPTEPRRVRRR